LKAGVATLGIDDPPVRDTRQPGHLPRWPPASTLRQPGAAEVDWLKPRTPKWMAAGRELDRPAILLET
ncbi:MAG: hypothetical protein ACRDTG_09140, partial [Pseudonocardiaceae bacterium]